jgi:hypothetical protein
MVLDFCHGWRVGDAGGGGGEPVWTAIQCPGFAREDFGKYRKMLSIFKFVNQMATFETQAIGVGMG